MTVAIWLVFINFHILKLGIYFLKGIAFTTFCHDHATTTTTNNNSNKKKKEKEDEQGEREEVQEKKKKEVEQKK